VGAPGITILYCGRTYDETGPGRSMEPDRPFSEKELEVIRQKLALQHESNVKQAYKNAWTDCEIERRPSPERAGRAVLDPGLEVPVEATISATNRHELATR
jgi:hypothetical protein